MCAIIVYGIKVGIAKLFYLHLYYYSHIFYHNVNNFSNQGDIC